MYGLISTVETGLWIFIGILGFAITSLLALVVVWYVSSCRKRGQIAHHPSEVVWGFGAWRKKEERVRPVCVNME